MKQWSQMSNKERKKAEKQYGSRDKYQKKRQSMKGTGALRPAPAPSKNKNNNNSGQGGGGGGGGTPPAPQQQNLSGMFGLDKIMDSFYNYQPGEDDEYGNMIKNTFASNMIQSAFDTQNAKDLGYAQAEIASSQMAQAGDIQRRNTAQIMAMEARATKDLAAMNYNFQNQFAQGQHGRDMAMVGKQGEEMRKTNAEQYASAERIADKQAATQRYASDKSAQASMYGADKTAQASMYGADKSAEASKYGADKTAQASMYGADKSAQASMYGADKSAEASMYGADKQLEGIKDTNRTSTENIRVTGDQNRKTQDNEQRLRALNRTQEHKMARGTARAF